MSTETIAPKIIQRPANIQLQKRPPVEEKVSPSRRSDDTSGEMKVLAKPEINPQPPSATNESCSTGLEKEEKKDDAAVTNSDGSAAAEISTVAQADEWNPLEEVDSALLTALCDVKERKALVRLESILVDFMKDASLTSIDVGGAFNSIVVGLRQQQTTENENSTTATGGVATNEDDTTTFVPSQSQGLQDLLNQYQRGIRQTSFQRLILHRLADRFNIMREQINNVNPNTAPATNERNTSERGLVDVGANSNSNYINNNWSPQQQQQQQNSYPLGLIRLIKKEESCIPDHLLINLDLSLLVNYKNPRARNFAPNNNNNNSSNNNNADEGVRTLSDNMNSASLDNSTGPKKPNKKMVIMKRNSSSNTSGSGEGSGNGKREGRSRRKKLEDREKAYEEARARIFGKEEKKEAEVISDEKGESAAVQESLPNSCHSSFSAEENNEAPPADSESAEVGNGIVPSQLISGTTPKSRSASPSPEPPGSAEIEGEQKQGQSKTKAVYRNRQQEENDPDFRRRSAYVPAAAMGVTPGGHMPPGGVPYNMVNPYAVNPYSAVPGQHVMMQQQPPHFYPHPSQVTPQDPKSHHYPGYTQPRVFYPAQPQQPQSQLRSSEQQAPPSIVPRNTNDSSQRAPRVESTASAPQVKDARPPPTPSWGPNARLEVKSSESAAPTNVAPLKKATPAKITTSPAKNEKREIETTLYKDEDFPALG